MKSLRRIVVSATRRSEDSEGFAYSWGLTRDEYEQIRKFEGIQRSTPIREIRQAAVRYGERQFDLPLMGTSPGYQDFHSLPIERGRFLTQKDLKKLNNVAVLGDRAARSLFPDQDAIGKNVRIGHNYFLVVGIAGANPAERRSNLQANTGNNSVYLPISTMRSRMGDRTLLIQEGSRILEVFELSDIEFTVPRSQAKEIATAIRRLLLQTHKAKEFQIKIADLPQNESS